MNEHAAVRPPAEIVLAFEPPFRVSATEVRPPDLEVEGPDGVRTLEPRVMKVLVALHRGLGAAVSRETLGLHCWGGRIVSEDALTRCIMQLRKALASDPGVALETIPTVGYRLQVNAAPSAAVGSPEAASKPRRVSWIAAATAVTVVTLGAAAWLWSQRPASWTVVDFRPLTSERSFKTFPALSPDGRQVAYAFSESPSGERDIHLRAVAGGEPAPVTSGPADDFAPAWSADGARIAFLRWTADGTCTVMIAVVPRGGERRLADCRTSQSHPTWLDDRTVVIADTPPGRDQARLYAVDVETGAARALTAPPPNALGDAEPQVSPDRRRLAFRRSLLIGADEIVVLDLRSGRERSMTSDGWKAAGFVWAADSRQLFYASNRGGAFGLWRVDVRKPGESHRVSLGLGVTSFMRMSADPTGGIVVELSRPRSGLVGLSPSGEVRSRVVTESADWDTVEGPDGSLAHVSDRGGTADIWVTDPQGRATRVTTRIGSYTFNPSWSPDGQRVVFVAVQGRRADIFSARRDGSQLQQLTNDGQDKRMPAFDASGERVLYVERRGEDFRLMAVSPQGAAHPVPGGAGWRTLQRSGAGVLYGQRRGDDMVGALVDGAWRPLGPVRPSESWAPANDGIYILDPAARPSPMLWFQPWGGPRKRLRDPGPLAYRLQASARPGVILNEYLTDSIDLGHIRLGPARDQGS